MSTGPTAADHGHGLRRVRPALTALLVVLAAATLVALLVDRIFFDSTSSPGGAGSGVAATQTRSVPAFTGVELAGANNVVVQVGPAKQSVVVHADNNLLGRVTTRVHSGRLAIGTTPGTLSAKSPMYVAVTVPSLDRIALQGAGNISVSGINGQRLNVALPGAGNIEATGAATKLDVTIGGEGTAMLHQMIARDARAAISGDGTIMVTATRSLAARISGTGAIFYRGDPSRVTQKVSGTGTISPGGGPAGDGWSDP